MKGNYFDLVFVTNIPAFYKIKLFNEISKHKRILVVYVGYSREIRNLDFFSNSNEYQSVNLTGNIFKKLIQIALILYRNQFKEIIIGGWDSVVNWYTLFFSRNVTKSVVVESSCFESDVRGLKSLFKRIFLSRIDKAYVPGISNERLLRFLGYDGRIIKTLGVGIFNIQLQKPYESRNEVKKFLYVGRLAKEKNIDTLISVFNKNPKLELNIVGFGPEEKKLKDMACENIKFLGPIDNACLYNIYQNNDVFILPSIKEPWGLVVEEALNNGLPIIVSENVGCAEELINSSNGLVFNPYDINSLQECVNKMLNIDYYNQLRFNISKLDFQKIAAQQVQSYISK
ncbi:MAG: glycosyltransferase family 4 protein [Bacteroidales bacterium]|nr:glycosyltransferase family 4 protein [Bacteroidales bacterium]